MKVNPNIDELLNSFLDGELPPRQQTEVQRLVARDPEVGRRLRQLQSCKTLIGALPRAEAPGEMLEQIKLSLERRTLLEEPSVSGRSIAGRWQLMARRFVAAAAMIALLGVLGVVVYQIVAPVPGTGVGGPVATTTAPEPLTGIGQGGTIPAVVPDSGFSGRLEIRTASFPNTSAFITRAVEDNGLSASVESEVTGNSRIFRVASTREGVNRLLASLSEIWQTFDAATLRVDRSGQYTDAVAVEAVTPEQAISIVAQGSVQARVKTAQGYARMNAMMRDMPAGDILRTIGDDASGARDLTNIDEIVRPAGPNSRTLAAPQGRIDTTLTIILLRTR
jgi:hypothetical protein